MLRLIFSLCLLVTPPLFAADWPLFRGPDRSGISIEPSSTFPLTWSANKNIKWKADLPGPGNSSPIVVADRVFLTCAQDKGRQRMLLCFSRSDGKLLWSQSVTYEKTDPTHQTNPYCASSPTADSDSRTVVAFHGSAGLHAYNFDGKPLWSQNLGATRHIWGYATSPVIYNNSILLNFGPGEQSALLRLDIKTGAPRWRTSLPGNSGLDDKGQDSKVWIGSWGTPLMRRLGNKDQILIALPKELAGFDPETGKQLWSCSGLSELIYTDVLLSPTPEPDGSLLAVAMAGYGGPAMGVRIPPDAIGDITDSARLWRVEKNPQRIGSGIFLNGHIFMASENTLQCLDPLTGKELWKARPDSSTFWSPASATADRIYFTSQRGTTYIVAPDPERFTLLASNPLDEATNSAPALSDGQIFLRTAGHLHCVGK